jgi:hypothetical protein
MGILRMIAVVGGVTILAMVVLTAGSTLMPGTKMRKLFGASAEALAGEAPKRPVQAMAADAGTPSPADGGVQEAAGR